MTPNSRPGFIGMVVLSCGALLAQFGCSSTRETPARMVDVPTAAVAEPGAPASVPRPGLETPVKITFNEHILPILSENCYACHGPDSSTRKAKLRLDRAEFATAVRGEHDPAIVPGKPELSSLVERIVSKDEEERMPPLDSHKHLQPAEIALLTRWVKEGATYQEHWSLLPPVRPSTPIAGKGWARNAVDHFVAEKIAEAGSAPTREEDPARLLRRVTFDLTGLPPTREDVTAFLRDPSPAAYERAVDRLLASDASAEQFTRHWLDAVRYADTHGIHIDNYRSIWPYRDWVLGAFRQNMPFDRFTVEQVAGDLIPDATLDQKVASGFNRCLPTTSEGGAIPEEYEAIYAKDRVDTFSTIWLGLTTGCAACHDHKFDPISTRDFYSLTAFFRNNTMPAMDGNIAETMPNLFVPAATDRSRWTALQAEIAQVDAGLQTRAAAADPEFEAWLQVAKDLVAPSPDYSVRRYFPLQGKAETEALAPWRETSGESSGQPKPGRNFYGPGTTINGLDRVLGPALPFARDQGASLALMVRIEETPSGTLLSSLSAEDPDQGWEIFLEDGKPGFSFSDRKGGVTVRAAGRVALAPGQWHHLLLFHDGEGVRNRLLELYVDGVTAANVSEPRSFGTDIEPAAPLRLGARHSISGPVNVIRGGNVQVQDVRYHDRTFSAQEVKQLAEVLLVRRAFDQTPAKRTPAQKNLLKDHYLANIDPASLLLAAKNNRLAGEEADLHRRGGVTLVMEEKKDSEAFAHVLIRGEYTQLGDKVPAITPAVLPPMRADAPRNRLTLARWLVAPENPLTARVTVNRLWQDVFGIGLVESAGDFGVTGARPSHPMLLDWLAVEFRESGWDYRAMVRMLVTSATYRQSAAVTPALLEGDPDNRLLARGPRHRLDAEELRDQALAVSGLLVPKLGGRSVRPYQPDGIWEDVAMKGSTTRFYRQDSGEGLYRRSMYTLLKRTAPPPAMDILNAPNREVSCVRRERTNTPLQALVTLNEPLFVEASRQLATRAIQEMPTFDPRLDAVSWRLLGREFLSAERAVLRRLFDEALTTYRRDPAAAQALLGVGESKADATLPASEVAAWTLVASQVMNLDESLTK